MPGYSANLGFLWSGLPLKTAIGRAAAAGFSALEFHFPYETPAEVLRQMANAHGLPILSINTRPGNLADGEFGLAALPGREAEARAAIDEAMLYAASCGARAVHVMAGKATGEAARNSFIANLRHAAEHAALHGITCLIEPINVIDVPGYFLDDFDDALAIIDEAGLPGVRLIFDCYHAAMMGHDVAALFDACRRHVGHVQLAGCPGRNEPDRGETDMAAVVAHIRAGGYSGPIGAEYRPARGLDVEAGLGWLQRFPA